MSTRARWSGRLLAGLALAILLLLALPPVRRWLESTMSLHMLAQAPLLALAGALLAAAMPAHWRSRSERWNAYGLSGLVAFALVMSLLMIPRVLDLALADLRFDAAKWLALVAAGGALRLSWSRAGLLVQGFFLGNVLPMTALAGQAYQDSPLRLCNGYLREDQVWLGQALVTVAVVVAVAWIAWMFFVLTRDESRTFVPGAAQR